MEQFHSDQFGAATRVRVETGGPRRAGGRRSLTLAMLFFVPGLPLVGLAGGLRGLGSGQASKVGAGLAVIIGLVFTLAQGLAGYRGYQYVDQLQLGPDRALHAGFSGDMEGLREAFGPVAPGRDSAGAFLAELEGRYGRFVSVGLPTGTIDALMTVPSLSQEYVAVFERGTRDAKVEFGFAQGFGVKYLEPYVASIRVIDPKRGDLTLSHEVVRSHEARTVVEPNGDF